MREPVGKRIANVPGPIALPFFGTVFSQYQLRGKNILTSCDDQVKAFGPIVKHEHYWNYPIIVLFDQDDISTILKADKVSFRPPNMISLLARNTMPEQFQHTGLTDPLNEFGLYFRKLISTIALSQKRVAESLAAVDSIAQDLVHQFRLQGNNIQNVYPMLEKVTWDLACATMLGVRTQLTAGYARPEWTEFIELQASYWGDIAKSYEGFPFWQYFQTPLWKRYRETEYRIWEISNTLLSDMARAEPYGILSEIFMTQEFKDDEKPVLIADLLMASSHPVTNSILYAMYLIARHPEVQSKLQKELIERLPTKDTPITLEGIEAMEYLQACVKESFRVLPTTPNLARIVTEGVFIRDYYLPPGTPILLQTWYNCMKDENFFRAKEFIPERWLRTESQRFKPHKQTLSAHFGHGKQMCPGRVLSKQSLHAVIAKVFRTFKLECTSDLITEYSLLVDPVGEVGFRATELLN